MKTNLYYTVSEPTGKIDGNKYPAVILMHGMGSNEQDLPGLLECLQESHYVFSLRGPLEQGPGYSFFTIERIGMPHEQSFYDVLNQIEQFFNEIVEAYDVDPAKRYFMGFSQGAIISQSLVAKLGNKIAGIFAMSGYLPALVKDAEPTVSLEGVNVFLSHGLADQVIPYAWNEESNAYFEARGASVTNFVYNGGHFLTAEILPKIEQFYK